MAGVATRAPARERLLDAAEALFYERGIAATGVDAVLRRAEVAPATLYAHFGGKDHLVAAYLQRRHERWRATWDEILERCGEDPDERALSVLDALETFHPPQGTTRGCAFLAAAVEVSDPAHPAHEWLPAPTPPLKKRLPPLAAGSPGPPPGPPWPPNSPCSTTAPSPHGPAAPSPQEVLGWRRRRVAPSRLRPSPGTAPDARAGSASHRA